jgi:hypothetical protein
MPIPNIQVFGKPLEKLVETVSKGIGIRYKPTAIRNEADAKAYEIEKIAAAKAKALIIKADADSEIAERARQRLYHQEMNRQNNIDYIIEKTAHNLNETVSDIPVDEDWRTKFFNKAQDVTSDDLQTVWAKILANEINQPGQVSVRTLDILSNMSKLEAEKFKILSAISTIDGHVLKINGDDLSDYGISYDDLSILRAAGILLASDTMNVSYQAIIKILSDGCFGTVLSFKYGHFFISKLTNIEPTDKFTFNQFSLTPAGRELLPVLGSPSNLIYIDALKKYLIDNGYIVEQLKVTTQAS